ncbi:MAG: phosphoglucosamine mutase, partial [Candidatus Eisenbacteria bacterium]|nr:phosphoglucosamine mutase [Candidatus Eisenbacteria bacterium]
KRFPPFFMVKVKLEAPDDYEGMMRRLEQTLEAPPETADGLRWRFPEGWVHLRRSGTEPVLRLTAEADSLRKAETLLQTVRHAAGL